MSAEEYYYPLSNVRFIITNERLTVGWKQDDTLPDWLTTDVLLNDIVSSDFKFRRASGEPGQVDAYRIVLELRTKCEHHSKCVLQFAFGNQLNINTILSIFHLSTLKPGNVVIDLNPTNQERVKKEVDSLIKSHCNVVIG